MFATEVQYMKQKVIQLYYRFFNIKKVIDLKRNRQVHNYIGDLNTPLSTSDKTTGRQ